MLQDHPHAIHFKHILYFGEGQGWPAPGYDRTGVLVEIGKQRTAEARGLTVRRDDGIPKKVPEGAPEIIKEPYDYYRTPRAQHHTSRSVFVFTDFARLMDFNYLRSNRRHRAASRIVHSRDGSCHEVHEQVWI
jgi:hypothetical protein